MAQNGCSSSSHHSLVPVIKKEEGKKEAYPLPFLSTLLLLSLLELHKSGVIQYTFLCAQFIFLSNMFLRFIHVLCESVVSSFFYSCVDSIVWDIPQFIYLFFADGYVSCF